MGHKQAHELFCDIDIRNERLTGHLYIFSLFLLDAPEVPRFLDLALAVPVACPTFEEGSADRPASERPPFLGEDGEPVEFGGVAEKATCLGKTVMGLSLSVP